MKKINLEELINNKYNEGDRIYCLEYPNLVFIYEENEFIAYYSDGHDLFGDGPLLNLIKDGENYTFSTEPFINYPDESEL